MSASGLLTPSPEKNEWQCRSILYGMAQNVGANPARVEFGQSGSRFSFEGVRGLARRNLVVALDGGVDAGFPSGPPSSLAPGECPRYLPLRRNVGFENAASQPERVTDA